jgi:hypothetical protein
MDEPGSHTQSLLNCGIDIKDQNPNICYPSKLNRCGSYYEYVQGLQNTNEDEVKLIAKCIIRHRARKLEKSTT